jgi:methionine sulfoxide reductase heme-binding subunit
LRRSQARKSHPCDGVTIASWASNNEQLPEKEWMMIRLKAPWNERNGKVSVTKLVVFLALFAPGIWIGCEWAAGMLEPKPVTEAIHATGQWAVRFILLSLLVTPLRRIAQWPKLISLRRMIGLAAGGYAFVHFSLYVVLDQKFALLHAAAEIALRFYLTIGFVALLGLAALAATSTDAMIRRLGAKRWNRLHKLIYFIAALAIFHFYLQSKANVSEPVLMMGLYLILMIYRVLQKSGWPAWAVAMGAAVGAPLATALLEAAWYAVVRHIDFWTVLAANIDFDNDFRPSIYVAAAGAALVVLHFARNAKAVSFSGLFASAK